MVWNRKRRSRKKGRRSQNPVLKVSSRAGKLTVKIQKVGGKKKPLPKKAYRAVKSIVKKAVLSASQPKKLAEPLSGCQFAVYTHEGYPFQYITATNLTTIPHVQQLLEIPQFTDLDDHRINTATQVGDKRETDQILLRAMNVEFSVFLENRIEESDQSAPPGDYRCNWKVCLVKTKMATSTMTADAYKFLGPFTFGVFTVTDILSPRSKDYTVVKSWSGLLTQRPSANYSDATANVCRSATSYVERKYYHSFGDGKKVKYPDTNQLGTTVDGDQYFLISSAWDATSGRDVPITEGATTFKPHISGAIIYYYRDRD